MSDPQIGELLVRAEQAYRDGHYAEAETLLGRALAAAPKNAQCWHLTALVAEANGRSADALVALRQAATHAPDNVGILVDYADRLGEHDADGALKVYHRVITISPRSARAYLGRGRLLHRLARFDESRADLLRVYQIDPLLIDGWIARGAMEIEAAAPAVAAVAYDRALAIDPRHPIALAGRAHVALALSEADATNRFALAIHVRPDDPALVLGEAAARELAGETRPYDRLAERIARDPTWAEGQSALARMRWEAGDVEFDVPLRQAIADAPRDVALADQLVALLAGLDRFEDAANAAHAAALATGQIRFRLDEAAQAGNAGDLKRAEALFATLPENQPGRPLHEARHRLRRREWDRAAALLETVLAADPAEISAWALIDLLWRTTGDARALWPHGQPGLIAQHALPLDLGEIDAIAEHLRALHRHVRHPVGQSMRGGTQTRGALLSRQDPLTLRLRAAIGETVMAHWNALPPADVEHPILRHRHLMPTLSGSWSVRLTVGGRHVPHIHPQGLLSSASHWIVPQETNGREGWLELGRPPSDLGLDLPPIAEFEPKPGTLVLFPSTLFHGTRPFGTGERVSAAFDLGAG